ncbi:ATP-binding protein [Cerasicoccus maritimus]|uniref:ATP-binding protein n=1 Tax=Cerasicoccus maritimus TaxID=490089 RepID=UPI0028526659|nr:ATP-binding protein [Cerasicoccus maritimus]
MPEKEPWRYCLCEAPELSDCKARLQEWLLARQTPVNALEDALLVVEEVVGNVLQHGTRKGDQSIWLECDVNSAVRLTVSDFAEPFNPLTEIPPADIAADDASRMQGGFGFFIVLELSEHIEYHRRNDQNILHITLPAFSTVSS